MLGRVSQVFPPVAAILSALSLAAPQVRGTLFKRPHYWSQTVRAFL